MRKPENMYIDFKPIINIKKAKKEIYNFLRKDLKIPAKDIDKKQKDSLIIKLCDYSIIIDFNKSRIVYFIINIPCKHCNNEYTEIGTIKKNLEKMIKAIRLLQVLN